MAELDLELIYNPDTDVVRAQRVGAALDGTVAVPLDDLILVMSEDLDRLVAIDIMDLPRFVERYVSDRLVPRNAEGEALFQLAQPHLRPLMTLLFRNLGPIAKDRIDGWDEQIAKRHLASR